MAVRFPRYAPAVLFLFAGAAAGCDGGAASPTSPPALTSLNSSVTVEPLVVQPEFLHARSCAGAPPFGLRLRVILAGQRGLILRGLRFQLTDRVGTRALPEVIPVPTGPEAALPTPRPGAASFPASPIPIPGASPLTGVPVAAGTSQSLPFFLSFGCGVIPEGILLVATDLADGNGRSGTSQVRVRVGR